jgi:hypothetical protein
MTKNKVLNIINEVYPKIKKYYGYSNYHNCFPDVDLHHNIYIRLTGEKFDGKFYSEEVECNPDAEFDRQDNSVCHTVQNCKLSCVKCNTSRR